MSLILDALRRADAERERGAVPGLHAQQIPAAAAEAAPAASAPWHWVAIAALVVLLALLAWMLLGREALRPRAAPAAPQDVAAAAAPVPAVVAPAPAAAAATQPARAPLPVAEPAPWPAPEPRKPASVVAADPAPPTAQGGAAPAKMQSESAVAAAMTAPKVASVEPAILRREQLPESIRSQLPPLAVGGSIYSANAADRSLILDGRLVRENERLSADLTLERIGAKAAVLQFKGYRFEIGY